MPSNKPRVTVYTNETLYKKIEFIASADNRSISNYVENLMRKDITKYEIEYGEIKTED